MPAVTERDLIASESDIAERTDAERADAGGHAGRDTARAVDAPQGAAHVSDGSATARIADGTFQTITVAEETAAVEITRESRGGTRVRVVTDEHQVAIPVALTDQTVEITRHPVNSEIDAVPPVREEGDVTIISVVEERAVVVNRLFLTEEIHIRRSSQHRDETVQVTLRRQRAEFEPLTADASPDVGPDDLADHRATGRPHSA